MISDSDCCLHWLGSPNEQAGAACVRQRCAGLNRTGLASPPQDGPQDNIAAEFSVAADAASQNIYYKGSKLKKNANCNTLWLRNPNNDVLRARSTRVPLTWDSDVWENAGDEDTPNTAPAVHDVSVGVFWSTALNGEADDAGSPRPWRHEYLDVHDWHKYACNRACTSPFTVWRSGGKHLACCETLRLPWKYQL